MKSIKTLDYRDSLDNKYDTLVRLPIVASGSYTALLPILSLDKRFNDVGKSVEFLCGVPQAPNVISFNITNAKGNSGCEVYLEVYKTPQEVAKVTLADIISKGSKTRGNLLRHLVYNNKLLKWLSHIDGNVSTIESCSDKLYSIISNFSSDIEFGDALELIDYTESEELQDITKSLSAIISKQFTLGYDAIGTVSELASIVEGNIEYFGVFIKQIQFRIMSDIDYGCIGISSVSPKILPVFSIGGITNDLYNVDYSVSSDAINILSLIRSCNITDRCSYLLEFSRYTMQYDSVQMENINALVIHELITKIINKHRPSSSDVYGYTLSELVK